MKATFTLLTLFGLLISCDSSDLNKNTSDSGKRSSDTLPVDSKRQILIAELKRIGSIFLTNDKNKIAELFSFPLADTIFNPYVDDTSYFNDYKKNGDKITRDMFIKYYPQIRNDFSFADIHQVFNYLPIDSLMQKDTLSYDAKTKKEPCYKFYNIHIGNGIVTLHFGSDKNNQYIDTSNKSEDSEGAGDECEYASFWIFRFDGHKLHFEKQMSAG
jgi:hypothetical protein